MLFRTLTLIALVVVFAACGSENAGGEHAGHDHSGHDHAHHDHDGHDHGDHAHHDHDHAEEAGDGVHFGSLKITPDGATSLDDVVAKLVAKEGLADVEVGDDPVTVQGIVAKVEGTVTEVCQVAGCWFRIESTDGTSVFFKMKEHKAVPKDLVGKVVVAEGKAYEDVTSVEMLQHFAEDAGKSKEEIAAITEPKKEYKFFAEGVVLKSK